jgi:hypothetical protein
LLVAAAFAAWCCPVDASAAVWPVQVANGKGEAPAGALATPAPTAACVSTIGTQIQLTWTAIARATSYTIVESTTSATSGYSSLEMTTATSVKTGSLSLSNYWFEVAATIAGSAWSSPDSSATTEVTLTLLVCTQP